MISAILLSLWAVLFLGIIYAWIDNKNNHFKVRGIPNIKPNLLFGETVEIFLKLCTPQEFVMRLYDSFPNARIIGFFQYMQPSYFIRDPDLMKKVIVSGFDHFQDHPPYMAEGIDDLFGNSLLFMNGQKWRDMRATISPAFTGQKVRQMLVLVAECTNNMMQHCIKSGSNDQKINIEVRDLFGRCLTDVISSCAFGLHVDSFKNEQNELFQNAQRFLRFSTLKFLFLAIMPKLMKILNVNMTSKDVTDFFRPLVLDTISVRQKNNIYRPDMISMIMEVRKGIEGHNGKKVESDACSTDGFANVEESYIGKKTVKREWTDSELFAQCFIFYVAGLESSAAVLSALTYELALNPNIQEKLHKEITEVNEQLNGNVIDYDTLQKMKYLDQVVSETLRKWPPFPKTERICVKDFHFDDGITKLNIEKGTSISLPIYPLHHDPKYFPNPSVFDPDRFSDDNKGNIQAGTYLPFGIGPRSCIGSRFALMQMKVLIFYFVFNFQLLPNQKTQVPLQFKKQLFSIGFEKGVHLELRPRQ